MAFTARVVARTEVAGVVYEVVDEGRGRMTRIPEQQLPGFINHPIHLSWAPKGCVWILEKLETLPNGQLLMHLITPITERRRTSYADKACFVNARDPLRADATPVRRRRTFNCEDCGATHHTWELQQKRCRECNIARRSPACG